MLITCGRSCLKLSDKEVILAQLYFASVLSVSVSKPINSLRQYEMKYLKN